MGETMTIGSAGLRAWVVAALLVCAAPSLAFAQKIVYVVRHAERADGGVAAPTMSGAPADPPLSVEGEARAKRLADLLADAGIQAVYATEFRRTQDTAKPLATRLGLTTITVRASATPDLIAAMRTAHASGIVLVVGHSNTVPGIVKALCGQDVKVGDADYDGIFVVVPASGAVSRIKY
jgi:phosphohistidine phosphatase SixA